MSSQWCRNQDAADPADLQQAHGPQRPAVLGPGERVIVSGLPFRLVLKAEGGDQCPGGGDVHSIPSR
jgi:hypothetical protein